MPINLPGQYQHSEESDIFTKNIQELTRMVVKVPHDMSKLKKTINKICS